MQEAQQIKAYLGKETPIEVPESLSTKEEILSYAKDLSDKVMAEVLRNEEQIENLRQSYPDAELASETPFQLSKSTKSTSVEFLSDNDVEISTWISEADESPLVHKCLRLWFTLCKQYN